MSLIYTVPTIESSGTTFSELRNGGLAGILVRLCQTNTFDLTAQTRLLAGIQGAALAMASARQGIDNFISGSPLDQQAVINQLADSATVLHALGQAIDEAATLVAANAGTLENLATVDPWFPSYPERVFS